MSHPSVRPTIAKLLAATLILAAGLADAASGYVVTPAQEALVTVGMSRDAVRAALGRPAHNIKYPSEPGKTWTWGVVGTGSTPDKVFDVDFSADGKVAHTGERDEHIMGNGRFE